MSEIDSEPFPRRALIAAGVLVGITLALTGAVSAGLLSKPSDANTARVEKKMAIRATRTLSFSDHPGGVLLIRDVKQNSLVRAIMPGEPSGFIRGVLRSFARERRAKKIAMEVAYRLTLWDDYSLSLTDTGTGRTIELGSFGPDNRAAFAALLPPEKVAAL
jgi:putative photosynthetic complex assembly protein